MTPLDVATVEMRRAVDKLNRKQAAYLAEGLPFSFVTDPADPGIGLLAPVARVTMPTTTGTSP